MGVSKGDMQLCEMRDGDAGTECDVSGIALAEARVAVDFVVDEDDDNFNVLLSPLLLLLLLLLLSLLLTVPILTIFGLPTCISLSLSSLSVSTTCA